MLSKFLKSTSLVFLFSTFSIAIGCGISSSKSNESLSSEDYRKSEFGKWIVLPAEIDNVFAHLYARRDENIRTVLSHFTLDNPERLLNACIATNVQHSNEEIIWLKNVRFSPDGLSAALLYNDDSIPDWWIPKSLSDDYDANIAYWTHKGYGMGYLMIHEPSKKTVRILQFSAQHLTAETLQKAFPSR
jgi:hypothetical protein